MRTATRVRLSRDAQRSYSSYSQKLLLLLLLFSRGFFLSFSLFFSLWVSSLVDGEILLLSHGTTLLTLPGAPTPNTVTRLVSVGFTFAADTTFATLWFFGARARPWTGRTPPHCRHTLPACTPPAWPRRWFMARRAPGARLRPMCRRSDETTKPWFSQLLAAGAFAHSVPLAALHSANCVP